MHEMASRLKGRDYTTIRRELIEIVKQRAPVDWNPNNIADPMIAVIESIAIAADQLHYYIDSWRRECDMATATLQSSIYSYALREGYSMVLPRGSRVRAFIQPKPERDERGELIPDQELPPVPVDLPKFTQFEINGVSHPLYLTKDFSKVVSYYNGHTVSDQCVDLVCGELKTVTFRYSDIDSYSRIELPEIYIDGELVELTSTTPDSGTKVWECVSDVVTKGLQGNIYSLVPTFVSGATRLYIEFPINYRNLVSTTRTVFTFKYISISDTKKSLPIDLTTQRISSESVEIIGLDELDGFTPYESADSVRRNYPLYTRDFTALLTKQDYRYYLSYRYGGRILVYDKQDEYNSEDYETGVFGLWERSMYVISELPYKAREMAKEDLANRSSRSDMIWMVPFGYYSYGILIVLKADLSKVSETEIESLVEDSLLNLYNGTDEIKGPSLSVTLSTVHGTSQYIKDVQAFMFNYNREQFKQIMAMDKPSLKNQELQKTLKGFTEDYNYKTKNRMPAHVSDFKDYQDAVLHWNQGYDSEAIDEYEEGTQEYEDTHFLIPFCQKVVVWSYSI